VLLAFLNNINGTSIFVLGIIGLLLFGKDLPVMARKLAKEYFRYKRMISDATSDIRREMESAADQIEEEKRKLQREVETEMPSLNNLATEASNGSNYSNGNSYSNGSNGSSESNGNGSGYASNTDIPSETSRISEPPPKPAANPLSLDVPSPSSHRATDVAKSTSESAANLDKPQKDVPPPSKIPPVV